MNAVENATIEYEEEIDDSIEQQIFNGGYMTTFSSDINIPTLGRRVYEDYN